MPLARLEGEPQGTIPNRLSVEQVEALKKLRVATIGGPLPMRQFASNQIILEEGSVGNSLFVVLNDTGGFVISRRTDNKLLATPKGTGVFFGEIAALYPIRRTAEVKTRGPATLLELSTADVYGLMFMDNLYQEIHDIFTNTAVLNLTLMDDKNLERVGAPKREQWFFAERLGIAVPPPLTMPHTRFTLAA